MCLYQDLINNNKSYLPLLSITYFLQNTIIINARHKLEMTKMTIRIQYR